MKMVKKYGIVKTRIILCVCFLLASAALFAFLRSQNSEKDITPPVLQISEEDLVYKEGSDPSELIVGVQAEDDVDGDVSDTIRVRSIYYPEGSDDATVTYVAKDRSNNMGIIRRMVHVDRGQAEETEETAPAETSSPKK